MWRVSNPGPLAHMSDVLLNTLRGPAAAQQYIRIFEVTDVTYLPTRHVGFI